MLLLSLSASGSGATDTKPITIMAPASPGGGWDRTARAMQAALSKVTGQNVQVYNVPGAGGTIGLAQFVNDHAGDPSRIMVGGLVMLGAIQMNRSPVTIDRVTPIATLTAEWEAIAVRANSKYQTFRQLVDDFKANPGSISWGGGSAGGTDHILVGLIAREAGAEPSKVNYIAHAGGGEALTSLLSGAVTAGVAGRSEFEAQVTAGRLRLLAVSSEQRIQGVDAPTIRDSGLNVTLANWRAVFGPPDISDAQRSALVAVVEKMHKTEEWQQALRKNEWEDFFKTGSDFAMFLKHEQARVKDVALHRAAGIRLFPVLVVAGLVTLIAIFLFNAAPVDIATDWRTAGLILLTLALYAFALPHAGYIASTALFFSVMARLLGSRRPARDLPIGISLSVAVYFVFTRLLEVRLPGGLLEGFL